MRDWIAAIVTQTADIVGGPWENRTRESFNAKRRDEMLDG